jgi:hypothetical protein
MKPKILKTFDDFSFNAGLRAILLSGDDARIHPVQKSELRGIDTMKKMLEDNKPYKEPSFLKSLFSAV